MSEFSVTYSDLEAAGRYAGQAASRSRDYGHELSNKVISRLNSLEGGSSGYTGNADYFARQKIRQLDEKADRYEAYSRKIGNFIETAKRTDAQVSSYLAKESCEFRKSQGMRVNPVEDFFTYLFVKTMNQSDIARWFKGVLTDVGCWIEKAWDSVKYWYKCEGGKYIVNAVISFVALAVAAIAVGIAVIAFLGAVGVWATIVAAASLIGAAIALVDRFTALTGDIRAAMTNDENPAWAKRYDSINSSADYFEKVRTGNKFIDRLTYKISGAIQITTMVCALINITDFVKGFSQMVKNPQWQREFKNLITNKHRWKRLTIMNKGVTNNYTVMGRLKKSMDMPKWTKVLKSHSKMAGYISIYNSKGLWESSKSLIKDKVTNQVYKDSEKIWKGYHKIKKNPAMAS